MEVYKNIPDYENYQVSNLGNVKSLSRFRGNRFSGYNTKERLLKQIMYNGYLKVCLTNKNGKYVFFIHQLVAIVFLNHTRNGHKLVINHINNIKSDNKVSNLK